MVGYLSLVYSVHHWIIQSAHGLVRCLKHVAQPRMWSECLTVARVLLPALRHQNKLKRSWGVAVRPVPSIGGCVKLDKETNRFYPFVNTLRPLLARHTKIGSMCLQRIICVLESNLSCMLTAISVMRRIGRERIEFYVVSFQRHSTNVPYLSLS
jgi:hypothetical protein